jgi:hypothetical protein
MIFPIIDNVVAAIAPHTSPPTVAKNRSWSD